MCKQCLLCKYFHCSIFLLFKHVHCSSMFIVKACSLFNQFIVHAVHCSCCSLSKLVHYSSIFIVQACLLQFKLVYCSSMLIFQVCSLFKNFYWSRMFIVHCSSVFIIKVQGVPLNMGIQWRIRYHLQQKWVYFDRKPVISLKTLKIGFFNTLLWRNQGFGVLPTPLNFFNGC